MSRTVTYAAWAFAAGTSVPVMAILNARLARSVGGAPVAALVMLIVAVATSLAVLSILRIPVPRPGEFIGLPLGSLLGGCIVAAYVISVTTLTPRFGVANTVLFIVFAQIVTAAVIDEWGLLGAPIRPVNGLRLVGLLVVLAGVATAQVGAAAGATSP